MFYNCQFFAKHNLSWTSQLFRLLNNFSSIWIVEQSPVEHPTCTPLSGFHCTWKGFGFILTKKNFTLTANNQALPCRLALVFRVEPTTRTITATGSGSRTQEHSSPSGRNRFVQRFNKLILAIFFSSMLTFE